MTRLITVVLVLLLGASAIIIVQVRNENRGLRAENHQLRELVSILNEDGYNWSKIAAGLVDLAEAKEANQR